MSKGVMLVGVREWIEEDLQAVIGQCEGFRLIGECQEPADISGRLLHLRPHVVVMALAEADEPGRALLSQIKREPHGIRSVVISSDRKAQAVLSAFRSGADGYLLRDSYRTEMETALVSVTAGHCYLSPAICAGVIGRALFPSARERSVDVRLTPRQTEVLGLLAQGMCNKQIAFELGLSVKTVESHRADIMRRLNIRELPRLLLYALQQGLGASRD